MRYAKALVAVATAALLAAQTAIPMSTGAHGWVTVVLAGLGAFGVYQVRNDPMPVEPPPPAAPRPNTDAALPPRSAFFDPTPVPPIVAPPVPGRYPPAP